MSNPPNDQDRLFELMRREAFFKEKIILSSGKESDYYLDARRVTLSSEGAYLCGRILWGLVRHETFDAVGGPTLGADPFLGALNVLAHQEGRALKTFIVRKAPKPHGKQQQIEGPTLAEGARVILIDDVATTGKAFLQSIEVLEKMQIKAVKAVCLVDRQEGAREALAKKGCPLVSIFTARDFLAAA